MNANINTNVISEIVSLAAAGVSHSTIEMIVTSTDSSGDDLACLLYAIREDCLTPLRDGQLKDAVEIAREQMEAVPF